MIGFHMYSRSSVPIQLDFVTVSDRRSQNMIYVFNKQILGADKINNYKSPMFWPAVCCKALFLLITNL